MGTKQEWVELANSLERYKGSVVRFEALVRATEFLAETLHERTDLVEDTKGSVPSN